MTKRRRKFLSRSELDALAKRDLLFGERLKVADDLTAALSALRHLDDALRSAPTAEARANTQRLIDEGIAEARQLGERLLQLSRAPEATGRA